MQARGWSTAVIVTDPWHALRTRSMATRPGHRRGDVADPAGPGGAAARQTEFRYIARETLGLPLLQGVPPQLRRRPERRMTARRRRATRPREERVGRRAGEARRPHGVRARPGPGAALRGAAPARGQDPGRGARGERLPAHPADPLAGVRADRPRARQGARAATPTSSRPPASRTTSATRRSGTPARRRSTRSRPAVGGFEGNAQSLRILTRLEAKTFSAGRAQRRAQPDPGGAGRGLQVPVGPRRRTPRKYGVYDDDREVFAGCGEGAPDGRRCLEAQVMDWSDDIAYSVHDLEDAVHRRAPAAGRAARRRGAGRADRARLRRGLTVDGTDEAEVVAALDRLLATAVLAVVVRRDPPRPRPR